jgi:hypothetical protein
MTPSNWDDLWADEPVEGQVELFGDPAQFHGAWRYWDRMPQFSQKDLEPVSSTVVKFISEADRQRFAELMEQSVRAIEPRGIWFPKMEIGRYWDLRYRDASSD